MSQKALTEANIKQLCGTKAKTALIKGFISKAGKQFDAYLILDPADLKTEFEFEKRTSDQPPRLPKAI
jgi:DNA topoisomerase-3